MKKFYLLLTALLLTSCVGLAGAGSAPVYTATRPASVAPPASPTPDMFATANALQADYLHWQMTANAKDGAAASVLATGNASSRDTLTAAEVKALETQTAADTTVKLTLAAIEAQRVQIPLIAQKTANAQNAQERQLEISRLQAGLDAQATEFARLEMSWSATTTNDAAISTVAAPFTATVEAQRLAETLERKRTGAAILQVAAWGAVILAGLGLAAFEFVVIGAKWNREAVSEQLKLAQGSIMRAGDEAIQHNGAAWAKLPDVQAPEAAKPAPPIHDWRNPAPDHYHPPPLNDTERRVIEILKLSNKLYPADMRRIAGSRETGSGSMWDADKNAMIAAGIEIAAGAKGTFLAGMGVTRDELIWKIETGEVQL